ncbi:MAG: glycosyl hydrolase family 43, partial [Armatimonadota bacterium]|nr:glycosyl hydrolase family 43 [Armatimonadota bacterium]
KPGSVTVAEHDFLELPPGAAVPSLPAWQVVAAGGPPKVLAWQAGVFELQTAAGKTLKARVAQVPAPLEVAGAWEVRFPPDWGAPPSITLDRLTSWTEHPNPGVRYFSGTALYRKEVTIPADRIGGGKRLWLDLGGVKNLAEVKVNGRDLGVLWKPPFWVEVTPWVRPGKNTLEVRVTNLWPNRLIGDLNLPEAERRTFVTWNPYTKESPLLESGLLGPVLLRSAVEVAPR